MSAPTPSRHTPFLQELQIPSVPIPIPVRRKATDPPPRSPERKHSSSDLLFEMSPLSPEDAPLSRFTSLHQASGNLSQRRLNTLLPLPVEKDAETRLPYSHEPFLYSIPRIPLRLPNSHGCSQLEVFSPLQSNSISPMGTLAKDTSYNPKRSPSRSASCSSLSTSVSVGHHPVPHFSDASVRLDNKNILTSAFQSSISSGGYLSPSSYVDHDMGPLKMPLSGSSQKRRGIIRSARGFPAEQDKSLGSGRYPSRIMQTTAAAPVLSFAHVELNGLSTDSVCVRESTRVTRHKSPPARPGSPYQVVRGRKSSIRRERGLRLSDEELSRSLKYDGSNFGLEKYLPTAFPHRIVKDENTATGLLVEERERGRTRSRARGGLRG